MENSKPKILIADDEPLLCELMCDFLKKSGFNPITANDGSVAVDMVRADRSVALVILDIMMPEMDGWEACQKIREFSDVPIIMLTARSEEYDQLFGFEAGADDYVCKPFDPNELVARIKAVLRRTETVETESGIIEYENFSLDIMNYKLVINGEDVEAPPKEIELLYHLASNPNKVFTRDQLLNQVWGFEYAGDTTRTVDVHVKRIREKIDGVSEDWELKTVWGVGYKFETKE